MQFAGSGKSRLHVVPDNTNNTHLAATVFLNADTGAIVKLSSTPVAVNKSDMYVA